LRREAGGGLEDVSGGGSGPGDSDGAGRAGDGEGGSGLDENFNGGRIIDLERIENGRAD